MTTPTKYICSLSPELKAAAEELLGETDERRTACVETLREWLKEQPHLNSRTDDDFLLAYLRGSKFRVEKAKERIDMLLTLKTALPEFYSGWDPKNNEIQELLDAGIMLPLPGYDHKGRKILLFRHGAIDGAKYDQILAQKLSLMMQYILQKDEQGIINGTVMLMDATGISISHVPPLPLHKKMTKCFEDASPFRPQLISVFNMQPFLTSILQTGMSMMKQKMQQRLRIHADVESLHKEIPKYVLPKEYGGDSYTLQDVILEWKDILMKNRDELIEQEKYKADESKRPGKPKTSADLFGIEDSFKELNVD